MNTLDAYHLAPYWLKVAVASLHGTRLSLARYSSETDKMVDAAVSRENWHPDHWFRWQEEQLSRTLWHAAKNVPYYRNQWQERRKRGDTASVEDLRNWPVLDKETVRANNKALVADSKADKTYIVEHTSGTTGKPISIYLSRDAVRGWYALSEARWRGWYGASRRTRWAIMGGQLITPFSQKKPPFWVWNAGMKQLYVSSYHLAPDYIGSYLEALRDHRVVYLMGYASSLFSLAQLALEKNMKGPKLEFVISNAEPLYQHQREVISSFFQCNVYDTYGLSENVCAASECADGRLHLWPEVGMTEILDDDTDVPVTIGDTGRIVCTGFLNKAMPLIRYDVGDRGYLSQESTCRCGRSLPILGGIEGRKDDIILTKDGRRIGRLDPVFKENLPIREAQIIQENLDNIIVQYVPVAGCTQDDLRSLMERLQSRLGDVNITLKAVDKIPRSANGKFKAVVSNFKAK